MKPRLTPLVVLLLLAFASGAGGAPSSRLNDLARAGVEAGLVSYHQVAEAVYGEALDAIVERKRAWREARPEVSWLSDYDLLLRVAVRVRVAPHGADDEPVRARYTLEHNLATIPHDFAGALLAHEVGHGLSRRSVRTRAAMTATDHDLALRDEPPARLLARDSGFDLRWLGYVTTQAEFEIRLQALNRFLFEMQGRAVLSPADALAALAGLGVELDARDVRRALAFHQGGADDATVRTVLRAPRHLHAARAEAFRNADDLRKAVQMAALWDPGMRTRLLEKVAREAPGHF